MMRLPCFRFHAPRTVREAAELLASTPGAMLVAGGTDLLPNMKRRQQVPGTLVGLRRVAELRTITRGATLSGSPANDDELTIGAGVTLTELVRDGRIRQGYGAPGARRPRHDRFRRREPSARRLRPLSKRRHPLPDQTAGGGSHRGASTAPRRVAQHVLEAAPARLVRLPRVVSGGGGENSGG